MDAGKININRASVQTKSIALQVFVPSTNENATTAIPSRAKPYIMVALSLTDKIIYVLGDSVPH